MNFQPVLLWSDCLLWLIVLATAALALVSLRSAPLRLGWRRLGEKDVATATGIWLLVFLAVGLVDSLHYRLPLPARDANAEIRYGVEVFSVLDALATPLREQHETSYSAPLATRLAMMESEETPAGTVRIYPRLRYGGAHLGANESGRDADVGVRLAAALALAALCWFFALAFVLWHLQRVDRRNLRQQLAALWHGETAFAWRGALLALATLLFTLLPLLLLAGNYHVLGTDKVGQDVFYQVLKSVRTALIIGLVTTLVTLPLALGLGVVAGYFRGWVDDAIQYLYTVLHSIPGVLLIAAAVLMMQVMIDTHPQWFSTAAERADARLLALCAILGMTSWTGLARLLRGETLKLRELEYVLAARAFGVSSGRILLRHILPNLSHIVIITLVMDFSGLVLAEAVLSYVGIGVDPTMTSFGGMINNARMELSREPAVWWSLAAAFVFMFALVLSANLFADAVREAFDPRG
ncbi:MAG: ABC transporter permease [Zoogloeaceae bacterium]|nr:ABC transporter permease [Zoogloeaceae bacterium]